MLRTIWGSRRARIITSASALTVALAAGGGGIAIANTVAHSEALDQAQTAIKKATVTRDSAAELSTALDELAGDASSKTEALTPLLDPLASFIDEALINELRADTEAAAAAADDVEDREAPTIAAIPRLRDDLTTDELRELAAKATKSAAAWDDEKAALGEATSLLEAAADQLGVSLAAAADAAPDAGTALLATLPSADESSRAAVTAAADKLPTATDQIEAFAELIVAVEAAKAAHAAEEARKAEEAAQAAQGSTGRTGGGSRGGSGNSGGGGGSSGGGSTGGGSTGGGSTTPPVDNNRYADPRGAYTPGCALGGRYSGHDPGPGGTSIITYTFPYDYRIEGVWVVVYACR